MFYMAVLWLRFLKEVNEKMRELPDELADDEHIRQAAELCREAAFTHRELEAYDKYWDMVRVEKSIRESSLQEGRAKGLTEGEAIGMKKVKEQSVINGYKKVGISRVVIND